MRAPVGGNGQDRAGAVRDPAKHQRQGRAKRPLLLVDVADAGAVHKVDGVPAGEARGERGAEAVAVAAAGRGGGGGGGAEEGEEERGGRVVVGPYEGAEGEKQDKGLPGDKGTGERGKRRRERG